MQKEASPVSLLLLLGEASHATLASSLLLLLLQKTAVPLVGDCL